MDVTDVLRDRMHEPDGLQRMVMVSLAIHGLLLAVLVLAPEAWMPARDVEPRSVMTITLGGGTPGPQTGGMTQIGGRSVQAPAPPEPPVRREPVRPPAAKPPAMTLPKPDATPTRAAPPPPVTQAPPEARGRTPTVGEEPSAGSAVAETGARGQGFGLSTGGGGGSGSRLDVADFCCPDYIVTMVERVRAHWDARAEVPGQVMVMFTIQRDGSITDVKLEQSSGYFALDLNAQRALLNARKLPPLPDAFTHPTLPVHLNFEYTR